MRVAFQSKKFRKTSMVQCNGFRTIAPKENCPLVRVRVSFRVGGNFLRGELS